MLKNYLKIAFRSLWRRKGFSFINITGLAIGMASAALILLWIQNEWSYDDFHRNNKDLYHAWNRGTADGKLQLLAGYPRPPRPRPAEGNSRRHPYGTRLLPLVCDRRR